MDDGTEVVMGPGDLFYVPPGHDSWVVGDEPYVSLHFMGADDYGALRGPDGGVDRSDLDRLAERTEVEFFAAGAVIFKQGERPQTGSMPAHRVRGTRARGLALLRAGGRRRPSATHPGPVVAADVSRLSLAQQPCRALIREQPLV